MEPRPKRRAAPRAAQAISPEKRRDPAVRRQMSGPALRAFFNVAGIWELNTDEQRALLGWPAESTFFKYKSGLIGTLSYDTLIRVSLVLGIFKDLAILYPDEALAHHWIRLPNSHPMFGGRPAITLMTDGDIDGLYQVRRLLDARRGGWN